MNKRWIFRVYLPICLFVLCSAMAFGDPPPYSSTIPGDINAALDVAGAAWIPTILGYAHYLFYLLLVIDAFYAFAQAALGGDLKEWFRVLIWWVLERGFWLALLMFGTTWVPSIIAGFQKIGYTAAGLAAPLSPSMLWNQGLNLFGILFKEAGGAAWLIDPATTLVLAIGGLILLIAFGLMVMQLIVTSVESYMCLSYGYIFLGFGGSRWTSPYAKNYLSLAIGIGVKIMIVYGILQFSQVLIAGWTAEMRTLDASATPLLEAFDIVGGCLLIMLCVWLIPIAFSAMLTGVVGGHYMTAISPAIAMGTFAISAAVRAGAAAASGVAGAAAGGAGGGAAAASGGGSGGGSRGGYRRSGGSNGSSGGGASTAVDPPAAKRS